MNAIVNLHNSIPKALASNVSLRQNASSSLRPSRTSIGRQTIKKPLKNVYKKQYSGTEIKMRLYSIGKPNQKLNFQLTSSRFCIASNQSRLYCSSSEPSSKAGSIDFNYMDFMKEVMNHRIGPSRLLLSLSSENQELKFFNEPLQSVLDHASPEEQNIIGIMYQLGLNGYKRDLEAAAQLYRASSFLKNNFATNNLAVLEYDNLCRYEQYHALKVVFGPEYIKPEYKFDEENMPKPSISTIRQNFVEATRNGDKVAAFNLGCLYQSGYNIFNIDSAKSDTYLKMAAQKDLPEAHEALGLILSDSNIPEAISHFQKAIQLDKFGGVVSSNSMFQLWLIYQKEDKLTESAQMFQKACELGNLDALTALGGFRLNESAENIPKDMAGIDYNINGKVNDSLSSKAKGIQLLIDAVEKGHAKAMFSLGTACFIPNASIILHPSLNPQRGHELLEKAAIEGSVVITRMVADAYHRGFFSKSKTDTSRLPVDPVKSRKYYHYAGLRGDHLSLTNYGTMCINGEGGPRNAEEALQALQKAADDGFPPAHFMLGMIYMNGDGVVSDMVKAAKHIMLAADAGESQAIHMAATFHARGWGGIHKNLRKACELWEKAAETGNPQSMKAIGLIYAEGWGSKDKDEKIACRYFENALKSMPNDVQMLSYVSKYYQRGITGDGTAPDPEKVAIVKLKLETLSPPKL